MFKIEKDVPKPIRQKGVKKYPFSEMQVGDSFFVANGEGEKSVAGCARNYAKRVGGGVTFSVRTFDGGVRVWRES